MGWKWRLNHHVSRRFFSLICKHGKLRQEENILHLLCWGDIFLVNVGTSAEFSGEQHAPLRGGKGCSGTQGAIAKHYRSDQSRWPLCSKAHIHRQARFLPLRAAFSPAFSPAGHATSRKQVLISSRWAGAWRHAPLLLVNTSGGPSPPLIKGRSGARGGSLTRAIIKTEVMF